MKILICGGRHFNDYETFVRVMTRACEGMERTVTKVITGSSRRPEWIGHSYEMVRGVDDVALCWANRTGTAAVNYPAKWKDLGKKAGPIRNQQMLDEEDPNLVLAFPGGNGTRDMCLKAFRKGVKVLILRGESWVDMADRGVHV